MFHPKSYDEQTKIGEMLHVLSNNIEAVKVQGMKLQKKKSGLLHDLLTGRVPVRVEEGAVQDVG